MKKEKLTIKEKIELVILKFFVVFMIFIFPFILCGILMEILEV